MKKKKTLVEAINQIQLNNFDELMKEIKTEYYERSEECQCLRDKVAKFNKAIEIANKDKEIEDIKRRSLLVMSDLELERDEAFRQKHYEKCHNGNNFIYDLTGTGLGTIIKIKCPVCGYEEDITDDNW